MTSEIALKIANTSGLDLSARSISGPDSARARSSPRQGSAGSVIQLNRQDASDRESKDDDKKAAGNNHILKSIRDEFNLINNVELKFENDKITGEPFIKIVDKDSGDVVREIPPETLRKLAEKMDKMVGKLFDRKA